MLLQRKSSLKIRNQPIILLLPLPNRLKQRPKEGVETSVSGLRISIVSAFPVKDPEKTRQILLFSLEKSAHKRIFYIVYGKRRI